MNNTKRFDGKGEIYAKARPQYAEALFAYMNNTLNIKSDSVFADIGSGTGIFTEQLLGMGYKVYAVEPNADMRKCAEEKLFLHSGFKSVVGTDDNTNLPDCSVDYITVAQAFHWFDADNFKKECKRILKPNGKIFIVYNARDEETECGKEFMAFREKYSFGFRALRDRECRAFFDNKCDVFNYENNLTYDRQEHIDRILSSSYSLKEDDVRYLEYIKDINKLFDRFAVDGILTVPNFTIAYIGAL